MLDINNKSQVEIEELFSDENYRQEMDIAMSSFLNEIDEKYYVELQAITKLPEEKVNDLMLSIVNLVGNIDNGTPMDKDYPHIREFSVQQLVLGIANQIKEATPLNFDMATDIVANFDSVFWDLSQEHKMSLNGFWYTETTAIVDFVIGRQAKELMGYQSFRLPLVEQPKEWEVGESGGYHLSTDKSTLNKGEANQPQEVLDVLNKLQNQAYTLAEYNLQEEYEYTLAQIKKKNWKAGESEHLEAVKNVMLTTQQTYETMKDKEFYFEWKYDFRGRAYNTGYNITIQGNSYKKALINPVLNK